MIELTLFSAFLAGLFGSGHCIGMCGGIVALLTVNLANEVRQSFFRLLPYLLTYNLGRISSYMIAGMLAGFIGAQFVQWLPIDNPRVVAMGFSGLFMIALGLYIGAWWQILAKLEKTGTYLWRKIEPFGRRFIPVKNLLQALGLGLVWGWLPCGLVYSILAFALASGNIWQGGLLMLSFGLGTLPMLLVIGATAQGLMRFFHQLIIRRITGAIIILLGLFILLNAYLPRQSMLNSMGLFIEEEYHCH